MSMARNLSISVFSMFSTFTEKICFRFRALNNTLVGYRRFNGLEAFQLDYSLLEQHAIRLPTWHLTIAWRLDSEVLNDSEVLAQLLAKWHEIKSPGPIYVGSLHAEGPVRALVECDTIALHSYGKKHCTRSELLFYRVTQLPGHGRSILATIKFCICAT